MMSKDSSIELIFPFVKTFELSLIERPVISPPLEIKILHHNGKGHHIFSKQDAQLFFRL